MKTILEKFDVCVSCLSVGIHDMNCQCAHGEYHTINLEFEVCPCCNNIIEDGNPADTEYNTLQFKKLDNED